MPHPLNGLDMPNRGDFLKQILKFTYTTPEGDELEIDFYTELIDFSVPKKKLNELPATYAFVGTICAILLARAKEYEDELDVWDAGADYELRDLGWKGEIPIKKQIRTNPIWLTKRAKVNKAWREYMRAKAMLDALGLKYGVLETTFKSGGGGDKYSHIRPTIMEGPRNLSKPTVLRPIKISKTVIKSDKIRRED